MKKAKKFVIGAITTSLLSGATFLAATAAPAEAATTKKPCPIFVEEYLVFYTNKYKLYTQTATKCTYIKYRWNPITHSTTRVGYKTWDRR